MRTAPFLSIAILLGSLAVCAPGAAQPAAPPAKPVAPKLVAPKPVAQAMTEKARQLFAEGIKAYQQSRWADAHASFLAAWALTKHYSIAGNLADCELKLGLSRDAAEHFGRYVREMGKDTTSTPEERKDGEARYAQARARVGEVDVQVSLPGAEVYVDGKLIGTAPLEDPVFLDPGSHVVEARSDGYPPARAPVEAKAGVAQPVVLALTLPKAPPIGGGTEPDRPTVPEKRSPVPAIVAGGLAVGAAAVGVGLFVASSGKRDEVFTLDKMIVQQDHQRCIAPGPIDQHCPEIISAARDRDTFNHIAIGTFVGAGVLAAGALVYLLWPAPKAAKGSIDVHAAPVVGTGHGGLIIGGAF